MNNLNYIMQQNTCISARKCKNCGINIVCDSSGKAGIKTEDTIYVLGPCCCALRFCPSCRYDHLPLLSETHKPLKLNHCNYLKDSTCYLSGPIDFDTGPNWRPAVKEVLTNRFGIKVYDPFEDEKQAKYVDEIKKAKANQDWARLSKIAKLFVRKDLGNVDRKDFLIARVPPDIQTTGTVHEIVNANNLKKPVMIVAEKGLDKLASWYFGFIPWTQIFPSWEKLYEYLDEVNLGQHKSNNRWWMIYGEI